MWSRGYRFVVAPKEESLPVGTALLPLQGSGKVKAGQRVNLRLNNYPDQEFGYVRGGEKCFASADGGRHVCGRYCFAGWVDNQLWKDAAVDS